MDMDSSEHHALPDATPGVDYLRAAGSVKLADREGNLLLITRSKVYGFRIQRKSKPAKTAFGKKIRELVHDLFGYGFDQRKEGERLIANPLDSPEFRALGPTLAAVIEGAMLIGEVKLDPATHIEATRLGFEFSREGGHPLVFRGTSKIQTIADFLATAGIKG